MFIQFSVIWDFLSHFCYLIIYNILLSWTTILSNTFQWDSFTLLVSSTPVDWELSKYFGLQFQAFLDSGAQQQLYQKAVLSILNYVSYKKSDLCQIPSIDKTTFQSVMSWCVHVTHPLWLKEGGMKISFHQIQNIDSLAISHLCLGQHGFQVSYELLLVL